MKSMSRMLFLVFAAPALVACSWRGPQITEVRREANWLAGYLQYAPNSGVAPFDHPRELKVDELGRALTAVVFQEEKTFHPQSARKVFLDEEAALLAPALANLLAKATPQQAVYFSLLREKGEAVSLFSRVSSGQLFVRDRRLILVFGDLQREKVEPAPLDRRSENFGHPGRDYRKNWTLLENELVRRALRPGRPGEKLLNQVEIEVAALASPAAAAAPATPPPAATASAPPPAAPLSPPAAAEPEGLEQKLQKLKHLYDKGLINDRDYTAKKEELLKGL